MGVDFSGDLARPKTAANERRAGTALRILFVTSDHFPPFRPAAKAIFGEELAARGHTIDWLLQADTEDLTPGARPFGNGTAYIAATDDGGSRWQRVRKYLLSLKNDLKVFSLVRQGRYSLVQAKDNYLGALLALAAAKRHGVPFFYWLAFPHGDAYLYAARYGTARYRYFYLVRGHVQRFLLYRIILRAARHVFVQSEQMRRDLAAEGVPLEKMTPVPSSLNLSDIEPARLPAASGGPAEPVMGEEPIIKPAGERWIVYIGTLVRERHLDFLVRVQALVRARVPQAKLMLVGRGEQKEDEAALLAEAAKLGVADAVTITGWLPMQRAWDYVRAADVCLSPYSPISILRSTSPTKLVEYMALSKPVVANDHPEQSLVVQQSGAGIVTGWDEAAFAGAVTYLLEHEREAEAMGRAGRAFVERYRTHRHMGELVESRYKAALGEAAGASGAAAFGLSE